MKSRHRLRQKATVYLDANPTSQIIAELKTGDIVTVDESDTSGGGKWDAVMLVDGTTGYISGKTKAQRLDDVGLTPTNYANDYSHNLQELPEDRMLRAVVLEKAITRASGSLFVWGIINLCAWYFFREQQASLFDKINAPAGTFDTFIYGGAYIGGCMLAFGVFGAITRTSIVGWLDGLSLLGVGAWNIMHDFLLYDAVKPYGYTVKPIIVFIMLGIGQLIWGGKQIFHFSCLGFKPSGVDSAAKAQAHKLLLQSLHLPASAATGRIKFAIITSQSFPIYTTKTESFTMWLLPDRAVCLENSLKHFFEIDRAPLRGKQFKSMDSTAHFVKLLFSDRNTITRPLLFDAEGIQALNAWLQTT